MLLCNSLSYTIITRNFGTRRSLFIQLEFNCKVLVWDIIKYDLLSAVLPEQETGLFFQCSQAQTLVTALAGFWSVVQGYKILSNLKSKS